MRVHDFVNEGLGHSSYLIDLGDGTAAVIDPPRFPNAHEQAARRSGLRVAWTLDTHAHADYVTGSPALAARTGAAAGQGDRVGDPALVRDPGELTVTAAGRPRPGRGRGVAGGRRRHVAQ